MHSVKDYKKAERRAESGAKPIRPAHPKIYFGHRPLKRTKGQRKIEYSPWMWIRLKIGTRDSGCKGIRIKVNKADWDAKTLTVKGDPETTELIRNYRMTTLGVFRERQMTGRSLDPKLIINIALGLSKIGRAHV